MLTVTILHCLVMIFPCQVHVKRSLYNIDIQVYTANRLPNIYMEFHSVYGADMYLKSEYNIFFNISACKNNYGCGPDTRIEFMAYSEDI